MLMDLFYDTLPANIDRKRRVHFHAFMIEIHKAVVLCFDEFQVRIPYQNDMVLSEASFR